MRTDAAQLILNAVGDLKEAVGGLNKSVENIDKRQDKSDEKLGRIESKVSGQQTANWERIDNEREERRKDIRAMQEYVAEERKKVIDKLDKIDVDHVSHSAQATDIQNRVSLVEKSQRRSERWIKVSASVGVAAALFSSGLTPEQISAIISSVIELVSK